MKKKKREVSLLGALIICAITFAVCKLLKLSDPKTDLKEAGLNITK